MAPSRSWRWCVGSRRGSSCWRAVARRGAATGGQGGGGGGGAVRGPHGGAQAACAAAGPAAAAGRRRACMPRRRAARVACAPRHHSTPPSHTPPSRPPHPTPTHHPPPGPAHPHPAARARVRLDHPEVLPRPQLARLLTALRELPVPQPDGRRAPNGAAAGAVRPAGWVGVEWGVGGSWAVAGLWGSGQGRGCGCRQWESQRAEQGRQRSARGAPEERQRTDTGTSCPRPLPTTPPGLIFFTTYTLLVLFWAEIYHQARSMPTGSLRPMFVGFNALVYAIQVGLGGVGRGREWAGGQWGRGCEPLQHPAPAPAALSRLPPTRTPLP
jgi:hypothetical protein